MRRARPTLAAGAVLLAAVLLGGAAFAYYGTDSNLAVGYSPVQPVEFSHKLHAGDLGMDCRYCHATVEQSAHAAVPATESCVKCHRQVLPESEKLLKVRVSYADNRPIEWVRVHSLPDFAYFDHAVHLASGVGCSTCHGRVDQMARVEQRASLSMKWCLDCHRRPDPALRDPADLTNMTWAPLDERIANPSSGRPSVTPSTHCSGCHQ
jgi:hypothetical protein